MTLPSVSILLPVLDEAGFIDACLASLAAQDYGGPIEVVVAEGGSTDGTAARLLTWQDRLTLRVIPNPGRRQASGLNLAAGAAGGDILIRADAHTTYAPDYVSASIRGLASVPHGAVGGPMRPEGDTRFGGAVAAAMRSPLATGPARFHRDGAAGEVDTVYLGAFRREDFVAVGGFRGFPSGAGEDADFYHRMRRSGRRVVLVPAIRTTYRPRHRVGALLRQHLRYGRAKAELLWANGAFPSWRPLAPGALVLGLLAGVGVGLAVSWWPLGILMAAWTLALTMAAVRTPRLAPLVMLAAAIMHLGYGVGLWWGLLRGPGPVRRVLRA